jgi:pilus assembly protein Flp/PilA
LEPILARSGEDAEDAFAAVVGRHDPVVVRVLCRFLAESQEITSRRWWAERSGPIAHDRVVSVQRPPTSFDGPSISNLSLKRIYRREAERRLGYARASLSTNFDEVKTMAKTSSEIRRFLASEDGPTAVEYAVLVGLIVVALITVVKNLAGSISGTFSTVSSTLGAAS